MLIVSLQLFPPQSFLKVQLQREANQASTDRANAGKCTGGGRWVVVCACVCILLGPLWSSSSWWGSGLASLPVTMAGSS